MSQNKEIANLQKQQETLAASANQSLGYMQQQIISLQSRVADLEKQLKTPSDKITEGDETNDSDDTEDDKSTTEQNGGNNNTNSSVNDTDETTSTPEESTSSTTDKTGGN